MVAKEGNRDLDVLVVGAGPTGLILALELARRGLHFRIIDKADGPSTTSKALAIHSRSLEVLENMGVVEKFLKRGVELHSVNVFAEGKRIAHFTFDELDSSYPFALSIPQNITEEILVEELRNRGIEVERNKELLELENDSRSVNAKLKDKSGDLEEIKASWLVGADGAHSAVRHQLGLAFQGEKYPETWILGDVKAECEMAEDEINLYNSEEGLLAFFPYGGKRFRVVADLEQSKETPVPEKTFTEYSPPSLDEIQEAVDKRCPTKATLSDPKWTSSFSIHRRHVSQYRVKRVFLAGDAAHIHSPAGGQGMNSGMQDSFNLGWKLALAVNGLVKSEFLDSYSEERLAIALDVLQMTDFITRVNTVRNPLARHLRNKLAPLLSAQEVIQKRVRVQVSELALNYKRSSIVEEDFPNMLGSVAASAALSSGPGLHDLIDFKNGPPAGERAPDGFLTLAYTEETGRLYDILKQTNGHTLLIFPGPQKNTDSIVDQIKKIDTLTRSGTNLLIKMVTVLAEEGDRERFKSLEELSEHEVISDFEQSLHHAYGAAGDCLYLIRPDGYIGYRCQPINADKLSAYLDRHFLNNEVIRIASV